MNTYKSRKAHVNIIIQTGHKTADVGLSVQPVQFKVGLKTVDDNGDVRFSTLTDSVNL